MERYASVLLAPKHYVSNLTQGYFCQLKLTDYGQVKQVIYVRPYGMLAALEQFQQACQTQLWPGSEAEMCHSAVYFEEASHRLTPLACQWLDTLIAFAKGARQSATHSSGWLC